MSLAPSPTPTSAPLPPLGRARRALVAIGPAFVAATAYVDPGNFATNSVAGASHGTTLLWVVVAANLMAVLVQHLSAKLGLATGRNLAELCREQYSRPVARGLWCQAEAVAVATDMAEVVGGAVALQLLFGVPLVVGGALVGAVALVLLAVQHRRPRRFELLVTTLFTGVLVCLVVALSRTDPDPAAVAAGLVPSPAGGDALVLVVGILGATVMPHVIYLHSALTQHAGAGTSGSRRRVLRSQRLDLLLGMGTAGLLNAVMLVVAATVLHGAGPAPDDIAGIHDGLAGAAGPVAAGAFAVGLLLSGLVSSGVGTYAGQVIMQGFLRRSVPMTVRRVATLGPALLVLALGAEPTTVLVVSQVVLSFGIPFALVPLLGMTRRADLMGDLVNRRGTTTVAVVVASVVVALNAYLLATVL